MQPSQPPDESGGAVPEDIRARVMPAVIDELARWGVERFSVEAMAERHHLDAAQIYRYWGGRQRLIVDAAVQDVETLSSLADTGSLRGDLFTLARAATDRANTEVGRTLLRAVVMNRRGRHDEDTRLMFWGARFNVVRAVVDRARERGDLRDGVNTMAAVLVILAPLNMRALYSDAPIDDDYCAAIADMAWHAIARK
ncbi:MAG TPA: TetR-like C-terminal domain-containing protein [Mycobacterium sp.]|nr:TetR-like C-terminal domain-containing protein [Mycobacterium sp.]